MIKISNITLDVLNIITSIGILFLEAVGLAIIFGLMRVVNLAHGGFVMLGAYTGYICATLHMSPWASLLIAPIVLGIIGYVVEKILIRKLYGKIMESILATWGLSIVIRQVIELIFGKMYKNVPTPVNSSISVLGSQYPLERLLILGIAILVFLGLFFIQRKTMLGTRVSAVIDNPDLAVSLGINVNQVYTATFILGSMLAGFAGALIAPIVTVFPNMGTSFIIEAFLTVLIGGGTTVIGLGGGSSLLAGANNIVAVLTNPVYGSIAVLTIALIVMRLRRTNLS